jgi:uncharacterized membrane protein SpoIIM required for sporulation
MDLDAYSAAHAAEWQRLEQLSRGRLDGPLADELIERYQAGAAQLSAIRTTVGDSVEGERLTLALSRSRLRFTGAAGNALRGLTTYAVLQLPAALYRIRWLSLVCAAAGIALIAIYALWMSSDPRLLATLGSFERRREYAESDFVSYYSDNSTAGFAGQVWTNNALLATQSIAFGITLLWPIAVLFMNAQGVGQSIAVLAEFHRLDQILYLLPHGQLELFSLFVASAAGIRLGWSWIAPGARTRGRALAEDGRSFIAIVGGIVLSLLVSGVIEGFVTRQPWPWAIKIGIGTVALAAFLAYQWIVGRRAVRLGQTGDVDEVDAGARQIVAA